jgi:hypothetical protein
VHFLGRSRYGKSNIPTVVELVDEPDCIASIVEATYSAWKSMHITDTNPDPDPKIRSLVHQSLEKISFGRAEKQASIAKTKLTEAINLARSGIDSTRLVSVMNVRNKYLAHRLGQTREEKRSTVVPMKYGDEKDLLEQTIQIVDRLHNSINGAGFDWEGSKRIAEKNAKALWESCTFTITR